MNPASTAFSPVSARNNPFVVQRTDAIPFDFRDTPFDGMDDFFDHVSRSQFRGAIVGKHGRGKTTLLCDLNRALKDRNMDCELLFIPRNRAEQGELLGGSTEKGRRGTILLVDGIERLPFLRRQQLISESKRFAGFIATTHRRGRLPTLLRCQTSVETLMSILKSLGTNSQQTQSAARALLSTHRGNIRSVLRDLYDGFASGESR